MSKNKIILLALLLFFCLALVSASLSDTFIAGKAVESREINNVSSVSNSPAIVKILVYADYSYSLPEVTGINTSSYESKIAEGINPDMTRDINISIDSSQNMYDEWASKLNQQNYSQDLQAPFSFGTGFLIDSRGYILADNHLIHPDEQLFSDWIKGHILRTIERKINLKNVNKQYASYPEYLQDAALYNFLQKNLVFSISDFRVKVVYGGKEYEPKIIASEGSNDFSNFQASGWALLKITDNINFSYMTLGNSDKYYSESQMKIRGFPSYSGSVEKNAYPVFDKNSKPSLLEFSGLVLSEGLSGAPVLVNDSVIGMAAYNYPDYFGGNQNYIQPINSIKQKIANFLPQSSIKSQNNSFLWRTILIVLGLLVLLSAIVGFFIYRARNRVSDRILVITRPKPSIFANDNFGSNQNLGRIKTYY